jgi:mannobiose 2-epimerase
VIDPLPPELRASLASDLRSCLRRHVLNCWFPHAIDPRGGFVEEFDDAWRPGPSRERHVVYQARLTWTAAEATRREPDPREVWAERVRHGVTFLESKLWDAERGGFYWSIDEKGEPTRAEKHVYGNAFAIYALATAHDADPRALPLAQKAFHWLETHAHDGVHKGWREALALDGSPLRAEGNKGDSIGTALGQKSMNAHIHVLEALTALFAVWPDPLVKTRLAEAHALVRDVIVQPEGFQRLFFQPDWTPAKDYVSFGHDVETAFLLHESAHALGLKDAKGEKLGRALVNHAMKYGWDAPHGGFFDAAERETKQITHREKIWWVEAEGLNALLLMHRIHGKKDGRYGFAFLKLWEFIRDRQLDTDNGGWFAATDEAGAPDRRKPKSDAWTDPYHQARALWHVIDGLHSS